MALGNSNNLLNFALMDKKIVIEANAEIAEIKARIASDLAKIKALENVIHLYGGAAPIEILLNTPIINRQATDTVSYLQSIGKVAKGPDIAAAISYNGRSPFSQVLAELKKSGKIASHKENNNNHTTVWGLPAWFGTDGRPLPQYEIKKAA